MFGDFFQTLTSVEGIVALAQGHQYLLASLSAILVGEITIHTLGALYGSGNASFSLAVIAFASMVVFDVIIYYTVQILKRHSNVDIVGKLRKVKLFSASVDVLFRRCESWYKDHPVLFLIVIKLLPITKVMLVFFSMFTNISFVRFLLIDIATSFVWHAFVFLSGWLIGRGLLAQGSGAMVEIFGLYILLLLVFSFLFGDRIDRLFVRGVSGVARLLDSFRRRR